MSTKLRLIKVPVDNGDALINVDSIEAITRAGDNAVWVHIARQSMFVHLPQEQLVERLKKLNTTWETVVEIL